MQEGHEKRKEKYHQNLLLNCLTNLFVAHPNVLHDPKTVVVVISLCNLLIIDNQHSGNDKYPDKEDSYE